MIICFASKAQSTQHLQSKFTSRRCPSDAVQLHTWSRSIARKQPRSALTPLQGRLLCFFLLRRLRELGHIIDVDLFNRLMLSRSTTAIWYRLLPFRRYSYLESLKKCFENLPKLVVKAFVVSRGRKVDSATTNNCVEFGHDVSNRFPDN